MTIAIITGAAQGIGKAIALRLARDGIDVALCDLQIQQTLLENTKANIEALGRKSIILMGDISSSIFIETVISETVSRLGPLDIMIANAGIAGTYSKISTHSLDVFDKLVQTNIRGTFLCYQHAANQMVKQGGKGVIVGAGSVTGQQALHGYPVYGMTKAAIRALTQYTAQEFGKQGIRCNSYCPASVETEMVMKSFATIAQATKTPLEDLRASYSGINGGMCTPEDVANLVSWLCSDESSFLTGQSVTIDGGYLMKHNL
ncbi:Diacetyl reductase [(S)-acetoin forming] [Neolecta irregularis DAH-3]|uniref:Diacetyl reductase [(S)-acetoin forming] n=1 Tax=Neolecta irregularis (strain DAH-3) TaxID=1198029 RepID=A0A1U7LSZ4_NEOID|nr:Diacetyl reductase [(S)-acetoin forming] [Neolecta irregularis DAH-3]|eukprot:OLL25796.1 Diacetyl reductase [(S)-acetoin forming] [Neolecta irregularis DAH-3]